MAWHQTGNKSSPEPMINQFTDEYINGLVQDCIISSALAMEMRQSSTKPSTCICILKSMSCIQQLPQDAFLVIEYQMANNCSQ